MMGVWVVDNYHGIKILCGLLVSTKMDDGEKEAIQFAIDTINEKIDSKLQKSGLAYWGNFHDMGEAVPFTDEWGKTH